MAQTILLKRRTSDATAPTASDLTTGEVAVNAYSGKLYIKNQMVRWQKEVAQGVEALRFRLSIILTNILRQMDKPLL